MNTYELRALYICYLPLSDPLTETQVLSYLEGLAEDHVIHLLTFETTRLSRAEKLRMRSQLRKRGIEWHHLRYHKRPSVPATLADAALGAFFAAFLIRRHRLDLVHARVHVPAAMALLARPLAPHDLLFDIRGLMAEEYVDAGRWRKNGIPWKLTKWVESRALKRASQCVVLTPGAKTLLFSPEDDRVTVIPCCVDMSRFSEGADRRDDVRARLGLEDAKVLAYVGKFGGWYMQREMVAFFVHARRALAGLHFLILTQDDRELIEVELRSSGLPSSAYTIMAVAPEEMGVTLAAADLAVSFIEPKPSKIASSPTKVGEYLAAGLPVVTTAGVGALDDKLESHRAGVLVRDLTPEGLDSASEAAAELLEDPDTARRGRALARKELSLTDVGIPRYQDVYRAIARERGPR